MRAMRRGLVAVGALLMTYAVLGALADPDFKGGALFFLAGVLAAHDGLLLPGILAVGFLVGRFVPLGVRASVRAGLIACLAVTVVAFPLVLGRGRAADNPSLLPLPYGRGLLIVYGAVWATVAAAAMGRAWRRRTAARGGGHDRSRAAPRAQS